MVRRIRKKQVNQNLLDAIFRLEKDWKNIQAINEHSVENTFESAYTEKIARAKYLYLLKEARHRKLNALDM